METANRIHEEINLLPSMANNRELYLDNPAFWNGQRAGLIRAYEIALDGAARPTDVRQFVDTLMEAESNQ